MLKKIKKLINKAIRSLNKYLKDVELKDKVESYEDKIKNTETDKNFWENEAHKKDDKIFKLEKNIKDAKELILSMKQDELNKIIEILERR